MGLSQQISVEGAWQGLKCHVIGGLAVGHYGYTRDTADLDLLIRREDREQWLQVNRVRRQP